MTNNSAQKTNMERAAPKMYEALSLFMALANTPKISDARWMEIFFECADKAEVALREAGEPSHDQ